MTYVVGARVPVHLKLGMKPYTRSNHCSFSNYSIFIRISFLPTISNYIFLRYYHLLINTLDLAVDIYSDRLSRMKSILTEIWKLTSSEVGYSEHVRTHSWFVTAHSNLLGRMDLTWPKCLTFFCTPFCHLHLWLEYKFCRSVRLAK